MVNKDCYLKARIDSPVKELSYIWGATLSQRPTTFPLTCTNNLDNGKTFTAASGKKFTIECAKDYKGNDIQHISTDTLELCIDACAKNTECVNVSYLPGTKDCYLKNGLTAKAASVNYVVAAVISPRPAPVVSAPVSSVEPTTTHTLETVSVSSVEPTTTHTLETQTAPPTDPTPCMTVTDVGGTLMQIPCPTPEPTVSVDPSVTVTDPTVYPTPTPDNGETKMPPFPTFVTPDLGDSIEEEFFNEKIVLEPKPVATLAPAPPPGVDMGGLGVLTPDPVAKLWFNGGDDPVQDEGAVTVRVSLTYEYPSIILDNSMYIKDIGCSDSALTGRFDVSETSTPYYYAVTSWPLDSKVILITATSGCSEDGHNVFYLAESVVFDESTKTFSALGKKVQLADIFQNMDVDFGKVEPMSLSTLLSVATQKPMSLTASQLSPVATSLTRLLMPDSATTRMMALTSKASCLLQTQLWWLRRVLL
jgi:hypothetical protein